MCKVYIDLIKAHTLSSVSMTVIDCTNQNVAILCFLVLVILHTRWMMRCVCVCVCALSFPATCGGPAELVSETHGLVRAGQGERPESLMEIWPGTLRPDPTLQTQTHVRLLFVTKWLVNTDWGRLTDTGLTINFKKTHLSSNCTMKGKVYVLLKCLC